MGWVIVGVAIIFSCVIGMSIYLGDKIDKYEEKEALEKSGQTFNS